MKHRVPAAGLVAIVALLSAFIVAFAPGPARSQNNALRFDGVNDYVTFGPNTSYLGLKYFTIEVWFYREGPGVSTSTGTLGVDDAIPLLTKGRGETEDDPYDMNYFLGIRASDNVLCGDYEEAAGQIQESLNHPIIGVTHIQNNVWYHAALTYDGTAMRLYLNGNLEATVTGLAGRLPCWDSIQHAALGSALWTSGAPGGFFQGILDEARIWKRARTQQAIADSMNLQLTAAPGLNARWGLNEGTGLTATNSISGSPNGTLTNGPVWVSGHPFPSGNPSLDLGSSSAYVTFRNPSQLGLAHFTVETWFRRDGAGTAITTGTGGVMAIPLVTHGAAEADGDNRDIDYFLGIRSSDNVLCADFEEGLGGAQRGLNHPIVGATVIQNATWYHAAATYDGTTWRLYLNGVLENELYVGQPTNATPSQNAGLGTSFKSDSTANGFFDGALDEVRIWNYARNVSQIDSTINTQITGTRTGLVARWSLNEGAGSIVRSTAGVTLPGSIIGTGWSWDVTAPFNIVPTPNPPTAPSGLVATAVSANEIDLVWTDNSNNELRFEIGRSTNGVGGPFTPIDTVAAGVTSFPNTGLNLSTNYCYRVRAANIQGSSSWSGVSCATTPAQSLYALDLGSSSAYVTFRNPSQLGLAQFTVETWFRRDGAGTAVTTGTNGVTAIPLVTHGAAEADGDNRDIDYFLGIRGSDNVLCADFEEGVGGTQRGLNHPVAGTTVIQNGTWYHAAATYDGTTWRLYLNGVLETELYVGQPTNATPSQYAGLGTSLKSDSTANGFFDGALDEVRIWNYARNESQVDSTINAQITGTRSGLVARWGLNEGTGSIVRSTAGVTLPGSIKGSGSSWTGPAPFNLVPSHPPNQPVLVSPADQATGVSLSPTLDVTLSHPDAKPMSATFYGRALGASSGPPFSIIILPDVQNYTAQLSGGTPAIFQAQTQWLVDHIASLNIAYAHQIGDFSNDGDSQHIEWERGWPAMQLLENPSTTHLPQGLPYGVSVGNHDQTPNGDPAGTTNDYNEYFGSAHFAGRSYYGGHFSSNNDNFFDLFSASGLSFIVISLEYDLAPDASVLNWADSLLAAYPTRRGIICCHTMINAGNPGTFNTEGQAVYDALKANDNLLLMICGHTTEEGRRVDVYQGNTVHTLLADYQSRSNGGDGWLRIMRFYPAENVIRVKTYSPTLNQYEADADSSSQFTLSCDLSPLADWSVIGTASNVPSGSHATVAWPGLSAFSYYEWYVSASDGLRTRSSPTWGFRTRAAAPPTAPSGLTATALTYGRVNLAWTDNSTNELQFDIERSTAGAGGPFAPLATAAINAQSYADVNVNPLTQYCYRVRATNDAGSSAWTSVACATTGAETAQALDFGGADGYVTFGRPPELNLAQFTLECWFRRDGVGTTANTGSGGVLALPLVTKGRSQPGDGGVWDMNYFLGIRGSDSLLCADFEEGSGGTSPGLNHPAVGVTPIRTGTWYHAAATYDGTTWRLYLNGVLETELTVGEPVQSQSYQHAALGVTLDTAGVASGHFDGVIDEVRIWNAARTIQQIQSSINAQISTPQSGLVARWSLNEGAGTEVSGSAGTAVNGTIMNTGWSWTGPAPFDIVINNPPNAPTLSAPANGATHVSRSPSLDVIVSDSDADWLTTTFYGRLTNSAPGSPFSIVILPDAQFYTAQMNGGTAAIFQAQTRWVANHIDSLNIVYANQIGDCSNDGDSQHIEWERAWSAMSVLEDTSMTHLPQGLPYSVSVGNHDQTPDGDAYGTTAFYNEYFGVGHFDHRPYYGGHYGFNNDNCFDLFSASGLNFIVVSLEYNTEPSASVLSWADSLLKAYPTRRAIVCCHNLIAAGNPGAFSSQGQAVYNDLRDNANLAIMICAHNHGEGRRTDVYQGHTVHTILADYQDRTHGGDGWLRIMKFYPAENVVRVQTYSPTLDSLEADADSSSQFTLSCDLQPLGGWVTIGTVSHVASGAHAVTTWPGLNRGAEYEWYATVSDAAHTVTGSTWLFTTSSNVPTAHLSYPNGGEHLTAKLPINIQWTASDDVKVTAIDLLFSRTGVSGTYIPIATGVANTGAYSWRVDSVSTTTAYVKVVAYDGEGQTGVDVSDGAFAIVVPTDVDAASITKLSFEMSSAHPFQGSGAFSLAIPRQTTVRLSVYDVSGRRVGVLVDAVYQPGRYRIAWNGTTARGRVASGVYFMRLEACGQAINRKVVIVR